MTNASRRPARAYVDQPVRDLAAAERLARTAVSRWGLTATPQLLRAGMNALFAADDVIIRVSGPTVPGGVALELASFLRDAGIRVPQPARDDVVTDGPRCATAWPRLTAPNGDSDGIDWVVVGEMVRAVHDLDVDALPEGVPLPPAESFPWWDLDALLSRAAPIDERAEAGLRAAIETGRGWAATADRLADRVVCHGDVHPGNIMLAPDGPVLIDWDLLCWAPRGWDHGPLMTWEQRWGGTPGIYERFASGYGRSLRGDPVAETLAELRLVAATLMRVIAGRNGDAAAAAEAERRLCYWRGDVDAPPWRAQ